MSSTAFISLTDETNIGKAFEGCKSVKLFDGFTSNVKKAKGDFIIILSLNEILELESLKNEPNFKNRMKGLLIKEDLEYKNIFSSLLESLKLKSFLNRTIDFSSEEELRRIVRAWNIGAQKDLISSFEVISEDLLYVKTCDFNKFFVPVKNLKSLTGLSKEQLQNFELDEDGSYVHWPERDIHLDLENFRDAIDPHSKVRSKVKNLKYDKAYGKSMKLVREELGLTQLDLGLSDKQIRRYESGLSRPSFKSIQIIADAAGIEVQDYLDRVASTYQKIRN